MAAHGEAEELDCYPYTFSPLLLFAQGNYFDKGHSNYNSVAEFFRPALEDVDMLENVLYERKNMKYEDLLEYVTTNCMLVTCCIDSHFTAFQVLEGKSLIYYDPLSSNLKLIGGHDFTNFVCYYLLKCKYGDSEHIQEHKDHYTGSKSNQIRKKIYYLWKDINNSKPPRVESQSVTLNLDRYLLINNQGNPRTMSTQLTGNTCYFQTYLFAVLCKVGSPSLARNGASIDLASVDVLSDVTIRISRFLLQFFVCDAVMRPLSNSNFVCDFRRYGEAPYYAAMTAYLRKRQVDIPDYELQYDQVMAYYRNIKVLHKYGKFQAGDHMPSTPNTKSLQVVRNTEDGRYKLCVYNYYKYRAANMMFGFNTNNMRDMGGFNEFNSLRKNQLLAFYENLSHIVSTRIAGATKYRDYYFMPQFEIGQKELVDLHHYTYELDMLSLGVKRASQELVERVHAVNEILIEHVLFSTNHLSDYDKLLEIEDFKRTKEYSRMFLNGFMSIPFFDAYAGLGFSENNPKEKDINSMTQTVFYSAEMMRGQMWRQSYEFEKECINQMAKSTLSGHRANFAGHQDMTQTYSVEIKIGQGYTYSKYNTLMHFLNTIECYWQNPDINSIQVFGKDIRALLAVSCQKVFFEEGHSFYHYGPVEIPSSYRAYRSSMDLQMGEHNRDVLPFVSREKSNSRHNIVVTDRVYEHSYLRRLLMALFERSGGVRLKTDDVILNLSLLSLLLDFGLYTKYSECLNLPFLKSLNKRDTLQLQVEISNMVTEFDKANQDSVSRLHVEHLIYEASYKFMVNKNFSVHSKEFKLINQLNSDPVYHKYLLLCKIYISLCQINKSVEVDYYKVRCNKEYQVIIPRNFSKHTSDYLDGVTKRYNFYENGGFIQHDGHQLFDIREKQPEINLHKVRFDSGTSVESMVKYIEVSNVFRSTSGEYLMFIAGNTLLVDGSAAGADVTIRINNIPVEIATVFFNEAISFVPCFKYADSEDVVLFTSPSIHYLVDAAGQFNDNYYGMKHELIDCILSEEMFVDLNDVHAFKRFKLSEILTESKTVLYFPDYLLQVQSRQQIINLLNLAIYIRNISFFILCMLYLRRSSVALSFDEGKKDVKKITGPWREAILYVLEKRVNSHYDDIFKRQFFDLNKHENLPLADFVDVLCDNFTRYQRHTDGAYQIVPRDSQKEFLQRIIRAEECFHFSEVGSGKTKVIMPLLCQTFLSSNAEAHKHFARGGKPKNVMVVIVPEHLVHDAQTQVYRYCLNLNFREEYHIYDDIFALLHDNVEIMEHRGPSKKIFVTSFNQFKKALTYDEICAKIYPHREHVLVVIDEVDDFLDRDKLVFNICSNKGNDFKNQTIECIFEASQSAYKGDPCPRIISTTNPTYWKELYGKFIAIHAEIQEKSKSINKSFGIFNEKTLRHCSTNIAHDIEGFKSLIARPYESVNRAMPGSYYSDVERTMYLTYYILMEDIAKYDEFFQQERKFISFEYFNTHVQHLDFDDLVYGNTRLSVLVEQHPQTKDGLVRFLYAIILRRMEIQDKSRSVNAIDVVFNFDCIGFTGTPFIDNYPTFAYIHQKRQDRIPDLIDRSFYVYSSLYSSQVQFEERFAQFQGKNSNVLVEYVSSDFVQQKDDELSVLQEVFSREGDSFNVLVDLCGIFKKTSIYAVRDLVLQHFGPDRFLYVYHIDQANGSDRVLSVNSDNDVQFDEEFYKFLCKSYDEALRHRVFFFIDNRNVIGKDIPFQLIYERHYKQPLFFKSVVLAHDVDDFSKIWQAMGRSRTMNSTQFSIYKNALSEGDARDQVSDIKTHPLTRQLYVRNCDRKMAGNLSSIYQTLISLANLSDRSFYHNNEIVNVFLEKMEMTIEDKVARHQRVLETTIFNQPVSSGILTHIFEDKFGKSVSLHEEAISANVVQNLLRHIVQQKFEQRVATGDIFDEFIRFLSGEQLGLTEIAYTKQQQKRKQRQQNKDQDADTMEIFSKENQMNIAEEMDDYFLYTLTPKTDAIKAFLNLPIPVPILSLTYIIDGVRQAVNVFPTVQFLYSNYVQAKYITREVKDIVRGYDNPRDFRARFLEAIGRIATETPPSPSNAPLLDVELTVQKIRQNPQFTLAAMHKGAYIIGMKDQFNVHDIQTHPLEEDVQFATDELGFVLFERPSGTAAKSVDAFGPYCIELYVLLEVLSKHEVAQNVKDYYINQKEKLEGFLQRYTEVQGKGFICWRFIVNETAPPRGQAALPP